MRKGGALDRILKYAAPATGDPGTDAMNAAAQAANGPAGMGLLQMPDPTKADDDEKNKTQEALRMAHELDSKNKEINGLRQQLQEAKMDTMRTQLKAEIEQEQTRMRDSLQQEHQKVREEMRKEQDNLRNQIRAEQKELDKKQSELQIADAQQKGNITAAKAQYEAEHTAAEADHKARLAVEQAQHQAQLDKDLSAHDVQIAQNKADSLMDIARQTTDMYVKQTEKARSDADKYFAGQQQQFDSSHPVISPALQSRLDGAMKSVGRVGKALSTMTGMAPSPLAKSASQGEVPQQQYPQQQYPQQQYPQQQYQQQQYPQEEYPQQQQPAPQPGDQQHFLQKWIADSDQIVDHLKARANLENEIYRLKATKGDPEVIAALSNLQDNYRQSYDRMYKDVMARANKGDEAAKEQMAQIGDMMYSSWATGPSDYDKMRMRYQYEQQAKKNEENNHGFWATVKGMLTPDETFNHVGEWMRERDMYKRRGTDMNWWYNDPNDKEHMNDAQRRAWQAAAARGLGTSTLGHIGWTAGSLADDALTVGSDAAMVAGLVGAPFTGGTSGVVGTTLAAGSQAAKKFTIGAVKNYLKNLAKQQLKQQLKTVGRDAMSAGEHFFARQAKSGAKKLAQQQTGNWAARTGKGIVNYFNPVQAARIGVGNPVSGFKSMAINGGLFRGGLGYLTNGGHNPFTANEYSLKYGWGRPEWDQYLFDENDPRAQNGNMRYSPTENNMLFRNQNNEIEKYPGGKSVMDATTGVREVDPYEDFMGYINAKSQPTLTKSGNAMQQFLEKWAVAPQQQQQQPKYDPNQWSTGEIGQVYGQTYYRLRQNGHTFNVSKEEYDNHKRRPASELPQPVGQAPQTSQQQSIGSNTSSQSQAVQNQPRPAGYFGLNNTSEYDRQSYQNSPYWDRRMTTGAYGHPMLNKVVDTMSKFGPMFGLPAFNFFPTRPMLANKTERYDPDTYAVAVANSRAHIIPREGHQSEAGQQATEAWGNYINGYNHFAGTDTSGGWVNDPGRAIRQMYGNLA